MFSRSPFTRTPFSRPGKYQSRFELLAVADDIGLVGAWATGEAAEVVDSVGMALAGRPAETVQATDSVRLSYDGALRVGDEVGVSDSLSFIFIRLSPDEPVGVEDVGRTGFGIGLDESFSLDSTAATLGVLEPAEESGASDGAEPLARNLGIESLAIADTALRSGSLLASELAALQEALAPRGSALPEESLGASDLFQWRGSPVEHVQVTDGFRVVRLAVSRTETIRLSTDLSYLRPWAKTERGSADWEETGRQAAAWVKN